MEPILIKAFLEVCVEVKILNSFIEAVICHVIFYNDIVETLLHTVSPYDYNSDDSYG
jgi:hypothetical protein